MTYQELYNTALSTIKSVCLNVSNWGAVASQFKSGYSRVQSNARAHLTISIVNPVSQVSSSTVDSQFSSWMVNSCGVNLSATVEPRGLFNFYVALASFVTAKVCIVGGQETTTRQIMYNSGINPQGYTRMSGENVAVATDMATCSTTINQIICSNTRAYNVRYNFSISNT